MNPKTKRPPSPEILYTRRKRQERRVAEELRKWSEKENRPNSNPSSTPQRVTRSGKYAPVTVSAEALIVAQNILRRFKNYQGVFFTHLEVQIMFFWHTCQAMVGANMDPALSMMITGILAPYATDMELHTRATEILRGERDRLNQAQAAELNEMVQLLVANGAEIRSWDTLAQGTMFYFKASNIAITQIQPPSTTTSPSRGTPNEASIQIAQSLVVREEAPPTPKGVMVVAKPQVDTRLEQLEEENCLLTEKVYYLEEETVQVQEDWDIMERKLLESEAENRRLRNVLLESGDENQRWRNLFEASLQIFREPWDSLKEKHEN
ncbi:uncharacterized protein N7496_007383 [Penicillium cataractarum]|uniref:Uncharacterized protein n=1 Tax=Penicillium cataractarum TaxID=2100454 RepID=A0A9W9V9J9_9EURO|nr:uncharacterized protein N7496_007383 [Penicillium cataractarum]KAJ5371291.1 hypothetical protein N7496_007383 [Penicillium cataractarum]